MDNVIDRLMGEFIRFIFALIVATIIALMAALVMGQNIGVFLPAAVGFYIVSRIEVDF